MSALVISTKGSAVLTKLNGTLEMTKRSNLESSAAGSCPLVMSTGMNERISNLSVEWTRIKGNRTRGSIPHLLPTSWISATFFEENMPSPPPPSPKHILRSHRDQITSLHVSVDNERLYSGDITGLVVLTATRTLRALVAWKAHVNAVLAVEEWEGADRYIVS